MKRMVVLLSLVGVIFASGAASQIWLHQYTRGLKEQMEQLSHAAVQGEQVQAEIRAIYADWEEYQRMLGMAVREEHLDEVEKHMKRAEFMTRLPAEQQNREELAMELLEAADAADELWQKEKISIQNIL